MKKKHVVRYLILLLVLLVFFHWVDAIKVVERVDEISWSWMALAIFLYILVQVLRSWRFNTIMKKISEKVELKRNLAVHFVVPIVGRVTPGRVGDLTKIWMVRGDKKAVSFAWVLERLQDFFIVIVSAGFIVFFTPYWYLYVLFVVVFIIGFVVLWHSDPLINLLARVFAKKNAFSKGWFKEHFKQLPVKLHTRLLMQTILVWATSFGALYFLAVSIGLHMSYGKLAAIVAAATIIGLISGLPGGFGAREFSVALLMTQVGVNAELAGFYSLLLLSFIIVCESVFGIVGYVAYKRITRYVAVKP